MSFNWKKLGLIFSPNSHAGWVNTHAQVPTVLPLEDIGIVRIYFATRPKPGLSLTTFVDLSSHDIRRQLMLHREPVLPLGDAGMFDEHGIMPSSVVNHDGAIFLYYSGWSRGASLPYANFTGLAISEDRGKTFRKVGPGPILDRTFWGPYSATSPHVLKVDNNWLMIYCSGTGWLEIDGRLEHVYDLKIATSADGIIWEQTGKAAIPQRYPEEAITRPTIYYDGSTYHMWFCYRGSREFRGGADSYRLGYATSSNLFHWERKDGSVFDSVPQQWESSMMAYPDVAMINNKLLLFYNGNNFGLDGFGAAVRCSSSSLSNSLEVAI